LRPPRETAGFAGAGVAGKIAASWEYLSTQFGVVAHYLKLSLWPAGLNIDYWWSAAQGFGEIFWPGLLIGLLVALTAIALWRRPALGFAGLWFFLILAPSSSIMPIRDRAFEHRMYLPLAAVICLSAAAAWWLGRALLRWGTESTARQLRAGIALGSATTLAAAGGLGLLTWRRNQLYHDDRALYQDIVDKAPHNPRGHRNLGVALVNRGRTRQALVHLKKSIDLYYDSHQAHNNYGAAIERLGDLPTAVKHYRIAVEMAPKYLAAHSNLGAALSRTGDYVGAMKHFRAVMRLAPDEPTPYLQIGIIMASLGRRDRAQTYFKEAIRRAPRLAKAWYNLGVLALEQGDLPRALSHFGTAVACNPASAEARYNLGMALWMSRRPADALAQFRAIPTPGRADPMVLNAVAGILSTYPDASVRNGAEAVRIAEKLCRDTDNGNAAYLSTQAAAYAETGRFTDAVRSMQQAVSLARNAGAARSVRRFEARLRALRAGRPLRYVPAPSVGVARKLPTSD
ncbi:MAG: tetratricopeptide repeat protein, partial [Planctomycetota bacterium]